MLLMYNPSPSKFYSMHHQANFIYAPSLFLFWVLRPVKIILFILSCQMGQKQVILEKKKPDHLQAELGLSPMWPEKNSNSHRWDDERWLLSLTAQPHGPPPLSSLINTQTFFMVKWWPYSIKLTLGMLGHQNFLYFLLEAWPNS